MKHTDDKFNVERFNEFEEKYGLLEDEYDGFYYWAYIRFGVYYYLAEKLLGHEKRGRVQKLKIGDMLTYFKDMTIGNPFLYAKRKDIMVIPHPRRVMENGRHRRIYTDFIKNEFGNETVYLEFLDGLRRYETSFSDSDLYMDYFELMPWFLYNFVKRRHIEGLDEKAVSIVRLINEEFGAYYTEKQLTELLRKEYYYYKWKKKKLNKLIRKISPRVIVEVVYYSENRMIINEIASEAGIPTLELQHGVIGYGHAGYNFKIKRNYSFFPDKMLVYGSYWKEKCNFPISDGNIIPTGYPYLDEQVMKYPKTESEIMTIIVLSQPVYFSILLDYVKETVRILNRNNERYRIIYKLHPVEFDYNPERYGDLLNEEKVEIVNNSDHSLYYYFAQADIQLGAISTAIYEGLTYNLDTYIISAKGVDEYMGELCASGYASKVKSGAEFVDRIHKRRENRYENISEFFFERNAKEKICMAIKDEL